MIIVFPQPSPPGRRPWSDRRDSRINILCVDGESCKFAPCMVGLSKCGKALLVAVIQSWIYKESKDYNVGPWLTKSVYRWILWMISLEQAIHYAVLFPRTTGCRKKIGCFPPSNMVRGDEGESSHSAIVFCRQGANRTFPLRQSTI